MSKLHDNFDYNNLKFEYVGSNKDVSFHEYNDSKELFRAMKKLSEVIRLIRLIKLNQIKLSEVKNKQNEFLNKLINIKIGKKTKEQKEVINNLEKFYLSRKEVNNFLEIILKCYLMLNMMQSKMKLREKDLNY